MDGNLALDGDPNTENDMFSSTKDDDEDEDDEDDDSNDEFIYMMPEEMMAAGRRELSRFENETLRRKNGQRNLDAIIALYRLFTTICLSPRRLLPWTSTKLSLHRRDGWNISLHHLPLSVLGTSICKKT